MPKTDIDYSTTIIYKITCKDPNVKDLYVGHTTNFVQRKQSHKQSCTNEKSYNYKCKLYDTIRQNGGWDNWTMEIINFFKCENQYEARTKEQEYFVLLNATLNSIEPLPKPKPKEVVQKNVIPKSNYVESSVIIPPPIIKKYVCKECSFECNKQSNFNIHLSTYKHKRLSTIGNNDKNNTKIFNCNCGEHYSHRSSLSRHKKKCTSTSVETNNHVNQKLIPTIQQSNEQYLCGIVNLLIKENHEVRNLVITQHNSLIDQNKILTDQNKTLVELLKNQQSIINCTN